MGRRQQEEHKGRHSSRRQKKKNDSGQKFVLSVTNLPYFAKSFFISNHDKVNPLGYPYREKSIFPKI